jgi:hypothetical protein
MVNSPLFFLLDETVVLRTGSSHDCYSRSQIDALGWNRWIFQPSVYLLDISSGVSVCTSFFFVSSRDCHHALRRCLRAIVIMHSTVSSRDGLGKMDFSLGNNLRGACTWESIFSMLRCVLHEWAGVEPIFLKFIIFF